MNSIYPDGGQTTPLNVKPTLARHPLILSGFANPLRNSYLQEEVFIHVQTTEIVMV